MYIYNIYILQYIVQYKWRKTWQSPVNLHFAICAGTSPYLRGKKKHYKQVQITSVC